MNSICLKNIYFSKEIFTECLVDVKPYEGVIRASFSLLSLYTPIQKPMLALYGGMACYSQFQRCFSKKHLSSCVEESLFLGFMVGSIFSPRLVRPLFFVNETRKDFEKLCSEKQFDLRTLVSLAYNLATFSALLATPYGIVQLELFLVSYLLVACLAVLDLKQVYEEEGKSTVEILLYSLLLIARIYQVNLGAKDLYRKIHSPIQSSLQALPPWAQEQREVEAIKNQLGQDCSIVKIENSHSYEVMQKGVLKIVEINYLPRADGLCGPIDFELIIL